MRDKPANPDRYAPDRVIAAIAARQHGVVAVAQITGAGIGRSGVARRVAAGRLHRVHRGVYAVGHAGLTDEGRWMAAVLACGEGAVLSHLSAAALWTLFSTAAFVVDVTVPDPGGREQRHGIRLHRSRTLFPAQTTRRNGIPVTTPARTIADLRRVVSAERLRRAIRLAEIQGFSVDSGASRDRTRSELEGRFLRLCRRRHIPMPEVNVEVGRFLVDFLWRRQRLIVETDGYRYHRGRQAFEDDRARDMELQRRGYRVIRFTHRQVEQEPLAVAETLRALL